MLGTTSSNHARTTWLNARAPRGRIIAALIFVLLVAALQHWTALTAALLVAMVTATAARTWSRQRCRMLGEMTALLAFIVVTLPLSMPGTAVATLGPLAWSDAGIAMAGKISLRAYASALMTISLIGSLTPSMFAHAMAQLGVSAKFVHILLFCIRYVHDLRHEYQRLRTAMKLRAFRPGCNMHTLRTLGYLIGMLLVRSLDRAERVFAAMRCRGFQGRLYLLTEERFATADLVFTAGAAGLCLALAVLEWVP